MKLIEYTRISAKLIIIYYEKLSIASSNIMKKDKSSFHLETVMYKNPRRTFIKQSTTVKKLGESTMLSWFNPEIGVDIN